MAQVVRDAEWVGRDSRNLSRVLTFIAVMLAALGLYAVTSYAVSQQTHEIGLRMALGAGRRQVVWFIARRVALQLAIGLAAGIACTKIWGSIFSTGRAGVTLADIESLVGVALILIAIAIVACFVPVRRATRARSGGGDQTRLSVAVQLHGVPASRLPSIRRRRQLYGTLDPMTAKSEARPGRNEPCHCGSGRKYKQCCLEKDEKKASAARAKAAAAAEAPEPAAERPRRSGDREAQARAEAGIEPAVEGDHQPRLHPARADAAQGRRQLEAMLNADC